MRRRQVLILETHDRGTRCAVRGAEVIGVLNTGDPHRYDNPRAAVLDGWHLLSPPVWVDVAGVYEWWFEREEPTT